MRRGGQQQQVVRYFEICKDRDGRDGAICKVCREAGRKVFLKMTNLTKGTTSGLHSHIHSTRTPA